jgi:parvulin-like peptidyl-prolyl isomerase
MLARLCVGLGVMLVCVEAMGCMAEAGPRVSAQEPGLVGAIAAAGRGDRYDGPVRAQSEEQPKNNQPLDRPGELAPRPAAQVAVLVNGEAILEAEVQASAVQQAGALAGLPEAERQAKEKEIRKDAINSLIEREVVVQDAKNKLGDRSDKIMRKLQEAADKEFRKTWMKPIMESNGWKTEEQLVEALENAGTSFKAVKYGWERRFMAQEYLRNRVFPLLDRVGHLQIEDYYRKHPDEFASKDSMTWQDIYIDATRHPSREEARRFADSVVQRIRKGEDFAKLAETYDNGDAHLRDNSEGEGHKRGEIRPAEAEETLFKLREKEVGQLVETSTGFHILRVLERTYAGQKPFDEKVQKQIRDKLRADIASKEMKRIVNDLKAMAIIEYP